MDNESLAAIGTISLFVSLGLTVSFFISRELFDALVVLFLFLIACTVLAFLAILVYHVFKAILDGIQKL
jgi:hypothetical protein